MGKKKRHDTIIEIQGVPIIESGYSFSKEGYVLFYNTPGRNLHLTCYSKNGIVNAHIKDSDFGNEKVWEREMMIEDVNQIVVKWIKRSIKIYHGNKKYWMLTDNFLSSLTGIIKKEYSEKIIEFDLERVIHDIGFGKSKSDLVTWTRIRDGAANLKPGLLFSKTQSYLVVPLDNNRFIQMNTNIRKNIFGMLPFGIGIIKFYDYLEKMGILSKKQIINDPIKKKALSRLKNSLLSEIKNSSSEIEFHSTLGNSDVSSDIVSVLPSNTK